MKKNRTKAAGQLMPDHSGFEKKLDFLLHSTGHLFPVTPQHVKAFEKLGISHDLPPEFDDADAVLQRVKKNKSGK